MSRRPGPRDAVAAPVINAVFDTLENIYSTQVLRGILAAAREMGIDVVVEELLKIGAPRGAADTRLSPAWIDSLAMRRRLGALVVTTALEPRAAFGRFSDAGLPVVAIDPPNTVDDSVVSVASSNFAGGRAGGQPSAGAGPPPDRSRERSRDASDRPAARARVPQRVGGRGDRSGGGADAARRVHL